MDEQEASNLPPEEDDDLNDETFGDIGGEEYNWEENQELFNKLMNDNLANGSEGRVGDQVLNARELEHGGVRQQNLDRRDIEPEGIENETWEESISRLVLDDFEDDGDKQQNERLRRMASTSNTYFMPPQVLNRNLQWFMDKEYSGDNSLLGSSVWSMHPTSVPAPQPTLPPQVPLQTHRSEVLDRGDAGFPPGFNLSGMSAGTDLTKLLTMNSPKVEVASPTAALKAPKFKTVDEIEQERMRESEALKQKLAAAQEKTAIQQQRPKVISVEELEREFIKESAPSSTPPARANIPLKPEPSGPVPGSPQMSGVSAPNMGAIPPMGMPHPGGPMMMPGHGHGMPHMRHGQVQRPLPRNTPFPHPNAFPPGMPPGMAPLPVNHPLFMQQQQQIRMMQMSQNHMRPGFPPFPMPHHAPNGPYGGKPLMMPPFPNFMVPPRHMHPMHMLSPSAIDAGLMTEKDKQRLKNIQIVQLQNDHPHTTDYYNLMRKIRLGVKQQSPLELLRLLFPKKTTDEDARNAYEPAHFENSLGKLQAQSALAPKKAIDTVIQVVDSGPVGAKKKCYRYLLLEIEQLYECLLVLEENDLRSIVATHSKNDIEMEDKVRVVRSKVEKVLTNGNKLSTFMGIRKGKFVVCRLTALTDNNTRMIALHQLLMTFSSWAATQSGSNSKSDLLDLYPYLKHCVLNMNTEAIERFCKALNKDIIQSWFSTKLGSSLAMVLLHQGEVLRSNQQQPDDQFKLLWYQHGALPIVEVLLKNRQVVIPPSEIFEVGYQRLLRCEFLPEMIKMEFQAVMEGFLNSGTKVIRAQ